jgi:hypothetical protein
MDINIDGLSIAELVELNKKVVARVKALQVQERLEAASQFKIGDVVSFYGKEKAKITGIVLSIKKTKATILTEKGQQWTVSPVLLAIEKEPSKKLLKVKEDLFPKGLVLQFPIKK